MIEIKELTKKFGKLTAINELTLNIPAGQIVGFLGLNGAGKSTTIKCCLGLLKPDSGQIRVLGKDPQEEPEAVKANIGYVPENPVLFPNLTANEFLFLSGSLYHIPSATLKKRIEDLLIKFSLEADSRAMLHSLSKGMIQKVCIAASLLHNPEVLIFDEPFTGLDAPSTAVLKEVLRSFAANGKTVLFSSHVMEVVEKLCLSVAVIDKGQLLASASVADVLAQTHSTNLENAFMELTGRRDIGHEARDILDAVSGGPDA